MTPCRAGMMCVRHPHGPAPSLDLQAAGDPRLEGTRFHHRPQTAGQLDSDDVGQVSGPEEHPLDRRTQVTHTPTRQERVIEHTWQRIAFETHSMPPSARSVVPRIECAPVFGTSLRDVPGAVFVRSGLLAIVVREGCPRAKINPL